MSVKNVYVRNRNKKKLERLGHYLKWIGARLRNLKKKGKGQCSRSRLTDATKIAYRILEVPKFVK